ncbi:hypothetical protein FHX06_005691 [Rhizobium sp. BK512]|nr:hypothetical protein [Rhizobium sp. BK512]
MIHELRIYTCLPGRLPALQQRFETAAEKLPLSSGRVFPWLPKRSQIASVGRRRQTLRRPLLLETFVSW